ncbi:MAG TPA: hypothetical protein VK203_05670 [Nostocaceae cyanobacterium]|nr:hypothetical protein [Nostocaceae cyanobacterium]
MQEFPLTHANALDATASRLNNQKDKWYFIKADYPLNGCLPISHRECGRMSVLAITREQWGQIVDSRGWMVA